jgi:TolB-like protein/DNA-binding winged helix-turn-helix (wHTH) protein/Flp pilus assembly protein TadD
VERPFRLGGWLVVPSRNLLVQAGHEVRIDPKVMRVLVCLAENPTEVVLKENIIQTVWEDAFVTDEVLTNAVWELRKSMGDDAKDPRFIQTVPRKGYRLLAPVSFEEGDAELTVLSADGKLIPQVTSPTHRARRRPWVALALVGAVAAFLAVATYLDVGGLKRRLTGGATPGRIESIAVLPLDNLSGDPEQDYFADAMTEALIADLAKISALKIISRTSAMRYKGSDKPLPDIARELGVDAIIEGSALRVGDRVRITAQLIEAATDQHLWAGSYERDLTDILALQREVARSIAQEIQVELTSQEDILFAGARPVNPEAHEAYLRGRHFLERGSLLREDLDTVLDYFQKALKIDPGYAPAYAGLADFYIKLGNSGYSTVKEIAPKAREAALKALELDESLAEAHDSLCCIRRYDFDWAGAQRECDRALELSPGSAEARLGRSILLSWEGRADEATAEVERALELDPLNLRVREHAGWLFELQHQYQRAQSEYLSVLELNPRRLLPHYRLAGIYILMEDYDKGVMELKKAFSLVGFDDEVALLERSYPELGFTGAMRRLAEWIVENSVPAPWERKNIAWFYTFAGEDDEAIQWLERAYEEGELVLLRHPTWDPLRSNPRFQDLLRRMNFPE